MSDREQTNDEFDVELYTEYRKTLLRYSEEASTNLDRNLIALAGGALAISVTFINQIVPDPVFFLVCVSAWVAFSLTLTSTLLSFFFSDKAMKRQIKILDEGAEKKKMVFEGPNPWNNATVYTNTVSIVTFVIGVFALVVFVAINTL